MMDKIKPVYIKLLAAAVAVFIIGVSMALSDLYQKIGDIEHEMFRIQGKCTVKH